MPKRTDSDANRKTDSTIIFTSNDECPECDTLIDVEYDTGKHDEDGLTDLEEDELTATVTCPNCSHVFESTFSGWTSYGSA